MYGAEQSRAVLCSRGSPSQFELIERSAPAATTVDAVCIYEREREREREKWRSCAVQAIKDA
jgi:hypothetical protein